MSTNQRDSVAGDLHPPGCGTSLQQVSIARTKPKTETLAATLAGNLLRRRLPIANEHGIDEVQEEP
jgi:hypothetical protein